MSKFQSFLISLSISLFATTIVFAWNSPTSAPPGSAGEALYIDSSGNVGIGTATPSMQLEVASTTAPAIAIQEGSKEWRIGVESSKFKIMETGISDRFTIDTAGNIGIGTSTPSTKLEVLGNADSILKLSRGSTNSTTFRVGLDGALVIQNQATDAITVKNGNVGIATTTPAYPLTVAGTIYSSTGGFRFPDGTSQTTAATAGTNFWTLSGSNLYASSTSYNIGIGTTAPKGKLDVAGGMSIGSYAGVNTPPSNSVIISGYVGIGTSTPITQLHVPGRVPSTLIGYATTSSVNPYSVYVQGRYAYVVDSAPTLKIFDVSNPASPVSVGSVGTGLYPISIYVQGRYAYVVNDSSNTLQIFDVSNPASPVSVGSVGTGSNPRSVYVQGRYAYVTNYNGNTLQIFDVSNPASPVSVGSVGTISNPRSVYVQSRYAYVTNSPSAGIGTLQVFDISNPASPVSVGSVGTGLGLFSVYIQGRHAYVINSSFGNGQIRIYDVGGAYIQQFEAGGIETGTLATRSNLQVGNDLDVRGGLNVGRGIYTTGPFSVYGGSSGSTFKVVGLPVYADNTTATAGGLTAGAFYRTSTGVLMVVY